jgi:hypothetical protein
MAAFASRYFGLAAWAAALPDIARSNRSMAELRQTEREGNFIVSSVRIKGMLV